MRWTLMGMWLVVGCLGCGGGSSLKAPELVPISGKITLDGKPLSSAQILFQPKGGTAGQGAYASSDENGAFSLKYNNGQEGCPKGEYVVLISKLAMKDGSDVPAGQTAADVDARDIIPAQYKDPDAPLNSTTVTAANTNYNIDLKSK